MGYTVETDMGRLDRYETATSVKQVGSFLYVNQEDSENTQVLAIYCPNKWINATVLSSDSVSVPPEVLAVLDDWLNSVASIKDTDPAVQPTYDIVANFVKE